MHPIPQRLAVHAADANRFLAPLALTHRRQSQKTPRLVGVLRFHGKLAEFICAVVLPDLNCYRHALSPRISAR
jgi:hypothetical protein